MESYITDYLSIVYDDTILKIGTFIHRVAVNKTDTELIETYKNGIIKALKCSTPLELIELIETGEITNTDPDEVFQL